MLAVAAIAWIQSTPAPHGPLLEGGSQGGAIMPLGVPFMLADVDLLNVASQPAVIDSIGLGPHTGNVQLVRVRIALPGTPAYRLAVVDPRTPAPGTTVPFKGYALSGGPRYYPSANYAGPT